MTHRQKSWLWFVLSIGAIVAVLIAVNFDRSLAVAGGIVIILARTFGLTIGEYYRQKRKAV